jgi:flagellar basal-body rod protein FlgB
MKLFDSTIDVLNRSLDLHMQRHAVIADNIANAETPGFKARRVDFEESLARAVEAGEQGLAGRDIASVQPLISEETNSELGQDLNTVDMDREMAAMTKNEIQYNAATQVISKKFALLRYAITEGSDR